ncbi:uncharacterized protein LOC119988407 isoform X2 [Tripterygium wilfordii]|uniref:uncharacterized protein LOC119988407 isoform X2 n=1 Tax=Tripterygium wilfordii TaxID=458696 RepID=UPI0018F84C00|nr:uncharacterized protein LOC119988407 isoform X2 [Tripterygium wilfordii]
MDMNYENKPQHSAKVAADNANRTVVENDDRKGTRCMDTVSGMEAPLTDPDDPDMAKVDIISFSSFDETRLAESDDPDATEHSSSFGDTVSDSERCSGLSEGEVESQFFGDSDLASYDAFNSLFQMRKKKLTSHWQNFIHPLKWRCKWAELKIKEIESQSLKYERELAACELRRHPEVQSTPECFGSKALPFSTQCQNRKARKRRKRNRVEDTTDIKSYFAHHNLFSHLENKRTNRDGALIVDDFGATATMDQLADGIDKFGNATDQMLLEFGNGDSSFEQTLWKIEMVHSRVRKLKNKIEMVMSKNAAKFSSSENLSLLAPYDVQTSSAPSPTVSAGNIDITSIEAIHAVTQHIAAYEVGDLVIPESAISIYGEAVHVPDIIESTDGLLSAADVTLHQPQIGDSSEYRLKKNTIS